MVAGELGAVDHLAELVAPERQLALLGDPRVLLTQTAGRGIARVGEARLPGSGGTLVERLEAGEGHVDLAAHIDHRRRTRAELVRQRGDGGHVGRDVLAHPSVATGGGLHEAAALVAQADREAVDLELAHVGGGGHLGPAEAASHALAPGGQLGGVHRVVEAGHRHAMGHRRERGTGDHPRRPHLLGRRIREHEIGVRRLERAQLAHQLVVVGIADLGRVEAVVAVVVVADEAGQLGGPRRGIARGGHGASICEGCHTPPGSFWSPPKGDVTFWW